MSDTQQDSAMVRVGTITAVHAVKGYVKIVSCTEVPTSIFTYDGLQIDGRPVNVKMINRLSSKSSFVCKLDICNSVEDAKQVCGKHIEVSRGLLPSLGEDEYYVRDLVGFKVLDSSGADLGIVREIYNFGAGDIIEYVDKKGKDQMLPLNKDFIADIDIAAKTVRVSDYEII